MSIPKKPLFIPLKRQWFEAFERGEKDTEYRPPNWFYLAPIGRSVVLSLGYGYGYGDSYGDGDGDGSGYGY